MLAMMSSLLPLSPRLPLCLFFDKESLHLSPPPTGDLFSCFQHFSSTWPSLNPFISNCCRDIQWLEFFTPLSHFNHTSTEQATVCSLCTNPNLSIKPADKVGAIVVWWDVLYNAEARHQSRTSPNSHPLTMIPPTNTGPLSLKTSQIYSLLAISPQSSTW